MARIYTASFTNIAVSAIQDIWELNAPADAVVVIHAIVVAQTSDYGDAQAEGLSLELSRSTGTTGSGGSAVTPVAHQSGDPAFGGTVARNNTTQALTTTVIYADAFNIQGGWIYQPAPEARIVLSPSARVVLELPAAPTDEITMTSSIVFEEIGG